MRGTSPHAYYEISNCRICGSGSLHSILDLGATPLADRLVRAEDLDKPELSVPLDVLLCGMCSLVQLRHTVKPDILFGEDYPYYSSSSPTWIAHCRETALEIMEAQELDGGSLVVELASNDGYMLKNFAERGVRVLGFDPAPGPASEARKLGIETRKDFFGRAVGEAMQTAGELADVLIANNVLAHVADLNGFVAGISAVLKKDGLAVLEVPYLIDLIEKVEFDTIYHQHLCYFSLTPLVELFERHNLSLNNVRRLPTHGGSLRLYVEPNSDVQKSVEDLLEAESRWGVWETDFYDDFGEKVEKIRSELLDLLTRLREDAGRLAAYGAAAKATTMASYAGLDSQLLDYVVDINPHKHGKFMPGNHLPIFPVSRLLEDQPDAVLMFAWNYADEIMKMQSEYLARDGKFVLPIPKPKIVA